MNAERLTQLRTDHAANEFWWKVENSIDTVQATQSRLAALLGAHRRALAAARGDSRLSHEGRQERFGAAQAQAQQHLQTIRAEVAAAQAAVAAAITAAKRSGPPAAADTAALLAELQGQRAWARAQRQLDGEQAPGPALHTLSEILREAQERGDVATLRMLADEAPSYLRSRGFSAVANVAHTALQEAIAPQLPPREQLAREVETYMASTAAPLVLHSFALVEGELAGNTTVSGLPGWQGDLVKIEAPT